MSPELEKKTMSIAEKLKAEGMMAGISQEISQGISQGRWVGRIQALQEFLQLPVMYSEILEKMEVEELAGLPNKLHGDYEIRFKR